MSTKVLITGATGYLGSHITKLLLKNRQGFEIIGTTRSAMKGEALINALGTSDRLKISSEIDMFNEPACFAKLIEKEKPQFVIHTAAPFFDETS